MQNWDEWYRSTAEERLKKTAFLVEATSFEQFTLWKLHHEKYTWEQRNGYLITVGKVNDLPVNICMTWDEINGKLVAFWHPVSRMVDHQMIDDWLEANFKGRWDNGHRRATEDAQNFHLCINAITEDSRAKVSS